jgi:flagellar basal-body rod modification protein FlgD
MVKNGTLGKDDFFQMLIAQLKYQDPLNPMDGTDFTAQLAQFSSLEQLANMNSNLETVAACQMKNSQADAVALIGKEVAAEGNSVEADGTSVTLIFNASDAFAEGTVSIYDSLGTLVKTIDLGARPQGTHSVVWDCGTAANGSYTFEIEAGNAAGEPVDVDTYVNGTVTGVSFLEGRSYIQVGDVEIPFENVIAVGPGK